MLANEPKTRRTLTNTLLDCLNLPPSLSLTPIAEKKEKHTVLHEQSDGKMSARDKSLSPPSTVIGAAAAAALAIILRTAAAGAARSIHLQNMIERETRHKGGKSSEGRLCC